ncbi:class F sortase [Amycolatopsis alkalitolerans]|uniref:Class F sortase n=1 Tax=Amycolatopsis alkalitolerans TaxID=2547244 RepID=A0A5C4LPT0_9PSEU|nr:class F sortase [Amycolatopsis alkalitolerans]TNC20057.1 class F sortase [Amycolatopsis alkalitolerans]
MRNVVRQGGRVVAGALLLTLALTGCGGGSTAAPPAPTTSVSVTKPYDKLRPTEVRIPKIDAESSLISVAVNKDGQIAVPPVSEPMQAAWYRLSPVPGDIGPAVILGHVDGNHKPGIFYRLKDLNPGDQIQVTRSDGKELTFVVDHKVQVLKDRFPADAVYGNTDKPQLRLITCGGVFDHAEHSYVDNIVVYANLA